MSGLTDAKASLQKTVLKGIYGLSRMGSSMLLDLVTILVFFLYFEHYGLNPILDGVGNALGKVSIAVSGLFMGYLSDRFPATILGRRKPFLIVGTPMLGISFIMLLVPFTVLPASPSQGELFSWMTAWVVVFNFAYGFLIVPYQSMMPETFNEKDRFGASLSENVFNFGGTIVGFIVYADITLTAFNPATFSEMVAIIGVVAIVLYVPAILFLPVSAEDVARAKVKRESAVTDKDGDKQKRGGIGSAIKRDVSIAIHNKNYVKYTFFIGISETGVFMAITALAGYVDFVFDLTDDGFIIVGAVLGLVSVVATATWWWMSQKRFNIHKTLVVGYIVTIAVMPLSLIVGLSQEGVILQAALFLGGLLAGLDCDYFLQYVMLGNIVEEDTRRTGHSRSGLYHGLLDAPENMFQGLGYVILGLVLSLPEVTVGAKTFSAGYYWWGPVAAAFLVLGLLIFRGIKVDLDDIISLNKVGGIATSITLFKNRREDMKGVPLFFARAKDILVDTGRFIKFLFENGPKRHVGKKIK